MIRTYMLPRVRDEGTPMIQTLDTPNLAFNYDHVSVYLGLYDISDIPSNPHVEGPGNSTCSESVLLVRIRPEQIR